MSSSTIVCHGNIDSGFVSEEKVLFFYYLIVNLAVAVFMILWGLRNKRPKKANRKIRARLTRALVYYIRESQNTWTVKDD
jgi:hypothetical protein